MWWPVARLLPLRYDSPRFHEHVVNDPCQVLANSQKENDVGSPPNEDNKKRIIETPFTPNLVRRSLYFLFVGSTMFNNTPQGKYITEQPYVVTIQSSV